MRMLLAAGLLAGCAAANVTPSGNPPDGPPGSDDGPDVDPPDGPGPDPDPVPATLQQTTNTTVAPQNSVVCAVIQNGVIVRTNANNWYRVFSLAEAGITNAFDVESVTFAVEFANNEPPLSIRVGTYAGTPDDSAPLSTAQMSFVASTTAAVANTQTATSITAPIAATIPAGSKLLVEIASTAATVDGNGFLLGTTNGPFQHTNYLMSAPCSTTQVPTAMANVCAGCGSSQAIITIAGTH